MIGSIDEALPRQDTATDATPAKAVLSTNAQVMP